ncbi:unnamed protein product [Auanema sp. JU1783]|nr:unnamed protein product [Auanema sp. JU1783]
MLIRFIFLTTIISYTYSYIATCPSRCQCYEDLEDRQRSLHLICKWEQVNSTNLQTLGRPERVRTLTIRCPHSVSEFSTPPPGIFHGLRNLDRLEIDRCLLRNLHPALLSGLHKLYSLIIKNSKLDDIPKDFFGYVPNLMTLDLTGNNLRIEPYSLRSLKNLIHLDLSNNSITFLANTLISLTKLKVLNMDHNKLANIDFRRLPEELTDLSLRHNSINTIHYVPNSARHLRRLDLAGNLLEHISSSGSVNVLPVSLRSVDLSHNRINYIQEGVVNKNSKLSVLDLKNNSLHELRESAVSGSASNSKLRVFLADNPLNCHCNIRWLLHLNQVSSVVVSDLDQLKCNHIIEVNQTIALSIADSTNQLMCKYTEYCPSSCRCCPDEKCKCRSTCPTGCTCYRSANADSPRFYFECKGTMNRRKI